MKVTKEHFSNSVVFTYDEELKHGKVVLTLLNNIPIGVLEQIEGKSILERVDEILSTHHLVRSFQLGYQTQKGSDFVWKNPDELFRFLTEYEEEIKHIAVIVPYHKVRLMVSHGYHLGIDLGSVNKRVMTLDLEAYRESKITLNPFAWDSIPEHLHVTEEGDDLNYSLVLRETLTPNDALRIKGKTSERILGKINNDPNDYFVSNFTNSHFDEGLNTLDNLLDFLKRHRDDLLKRNIRRLVLFADKEIALPKPFGKVMMSQDLNKFIFTVNVNNL